jgi:phosphatidylinositol alpha-1,6-mannosyltransferase
VYLEAQASGLPCIAGKCGGSVEAVEQGVTGLVLDEPSPRHVKRAIELFMRDPALCARMGGAGRVRMEHDFAPEVAVGRIEEALQEIID